MAYLKEKEKFITINLWNHVIIGTGRYHSFADSGLLDELRKSC
jgi:DNA repair protein RadC